MEKRESERVEGDPVGGSGALHTAAGRLLEQDLEVVS